MSQKSRKEKEKALREADIIDTAEILFFSKGYDNTTMEDIAQEAEFSKRTLYKYFLSKNELCLAIIIRKLELLAQKFDEIAHQDDINSLVKLKNIKDYFLNFLATYPMFEKAILTYRYHKLDCDKASSVLQKSIQLNNEISSIISEVIVQGKEDGSIRDDIDAHIIGNGLWGQVTGFLPNIALTDPELQETSGNNPKDIFNELFNIFISALRS